MIALEPRLWGEWDVAYFGSGTTIVRLKKHQHKPHLYIYADVAIDESRYVRDRLQMCQELADFLNGGNRPVWLDDFIRTSETNAESLAGGKIFSVGPMVDRNPPALDWVWDESGDAVNDRARLMDALFLKATEEGDP